MSINRTILLGAAVMVVLVAMAQSDPAYARRDTTVDQCPPTIACDVPSPGQGRDSGGPIGGGGDSSDDDSSTDDSDRDDTATDDETADTAPE
ncbi:MAG: hypothetical protein WD715_12455 [Dongiaceae bacterium]